MSDERRPLPRDRGGAGPDQRGRAAHVPAGFDPPEVGYAFEHAVYASLRWVVYNTLRDIRGRGQGGDNVW